MSIGTDELDLIGIVSSFLGPSSSDAGGPKKSVSLAPSSDTLFAPSPSSVRDVAILPARVVVFSKDRPWQLQQLLSSLKLCGNKYYFLHDNLEVHIILRASTPEFARGYEEVMHEYEGMHFLVEDDQSKTKSFSSHLERVLFDDTCENADNGIVMFLTDDCLLLEPVEDVLTCAAGALRFVKFPSSNASRKDHVFNFLSRLHPGISYCQTRDIASPLPRDEIKYQSLSHYFQKNYDGEVHDAMNCIDGVYLYNRNRCMGEWAYPFDLSGGVYLHCDVLAILNHTENEDRNHPNVLELRANQLLGAAGENAILDEPLNKMKALSAIPTRPLLIILAVNRVQDVFQAPLALPHEDTSKRDITGVVPSDPESLLDLLGKDCHLDVKKYKAKIYNSSHIGDFFIKHSMKSSYEYDNMNKVDSRNQPKVSVLIPVHRGPPDAASHSITSIIMQPIEEFYVLCKRYGSSLGDVYQNTTLLSPMQVVLVNDRCNDGSIDAMISACENLVSHHKDISFSLQDHRFEEFPTQKSLNGGDGKVSISVVIVHSPKAGIACALNHGLSYCQADLVARMDADDIAAPHRLSSQISFMQANPSFHVVGMSAVLFSTGQSTSGKQGSACFNPILPYGDLTKNTQSFSLLRPSLPITDPGFMAWAMLFSCSICHPSVLFRKNVIQQLGGYDESISHCEDYDLWLRLLNNNTRSVVCLPSIGLWHRKHGQNISSVHLKSQKEEADNASCGAMESMFPFTNDEVSLVSDQVSTLRNPASARSQECLDLAAKLLQRLELYFLKKNSKFLTRHEVGLVRCDCNARIGELASILVTKFGNQNNLQLASTGGENTSFAWKLWCERCPDKQLERLSLLCHTSMEKL